MSNKTKCSVWCVPGQKLCTAGPNCHAADGTYLLDGAIFSCMFGKVLSVHHDGQTYIQVLSKQKRATIPEVGSLVTARVLTLNSQMIKVNIIAVGDIVLPMPYRGTVKKINVRDHLVDKVEIYECFRPDDVILARVLSLGDARSYELSTSDPELGVVTARCEEGHVMVPVSWTAMRCQCRTESRKVAKVVPA